MATLTRSSRLREVMIKTSISQYMMHGVLVLRRPTEVTCQSGQISINRC